MIYASSATDGSAMRCEARINGPSIYLDHWAIVRLAEKEPGLRQRFLNLIRLGMELLFSVANAAELAGSQGKSADDVRSFLAGIGPRWFPVELDTVTVLKRENQGIDIAQLAASGAFVESFVKFRMRSIPPDKLVSFDDDFFSLAGALDWVVSQRESIKEGCAKFDQVLREKCLKAFARGKQEGKAWVDQRFPQVPFDENRRVNFVWRNLMRILIKEPQSIKKGDGLDFSHAVIGSTFASFATMDTQWKKRIEKLPKPNRIARVYAPSELEQMIADMESYMRPLKAPL